ncbi:PREDICTED: uncharacterized protein LOC109467612 [Branchiostoma belcheri]|uniref:Uncharacterized protein LOC109467612 n=1 Tax=Branchiostoma belcheri TaxID=7741 RepID=A0A6P4YVB1_BRABE|nr:PREDICTED: uncharacterized protein LOC109467612 [Branchiostoma belcheri]
MALWSAITSLFSKTDDSTTNWIRNRNIVYGDRTRTLLTVFEKYDGGTGKLEAGNITAAFNEVNLYPSRAQVRDMILCASECSNRESRDHILFGEFCIFVSELKEKYERESSLPPLATDKIKSKHKVLKRQKSSTMSRFEVFLGGSCVPSTWRQDVAIPLLKQYGLTYFDPVHEIWGPELVEVENQAKKAADLLLFVFDDVTRGVAAMVEVAYLVGQGRPVILVVKGLPPSGVMINGQTLHRSEVQDLERAHAVLFDLVERQDIPVFDDLHTAVHCAAKVLRMGISVKDLTKTDGAQPVQNAHICVGESIILIKEAFDGVDTKQTGHLDMNDVCLSYKALTGKDLTVAEIRSISSVSYSRDEELTFSFQEFCCIVDEFRAMTHYSIGDFFYSIYSSLFTLFGWMKNRKAEQVIMEDLTIRRDVFLGGSCANTTWREQIAIPLLRKHGITYFNPQLAVWNLRYLPLENEAKANCTVFLAVITGETRGLASMVEIAFFIGQDRDLVLSLEDIQDGTVINGHEVTSLSHKF